MAYEVIILYHLHMPYYVETFTEYPFLLLRKQSIMSYIAKANKSTKRS